jgi:hypothetical protein
MGNAATSIGSPSGEIDQKPRRKAPGPLVILRLPVPRDRGRVLRTVSIYGAFVLLPPLAMQIFKATGRNPLAGLISGLACEDRAHSGTADQIDVHSGLRIGLLATAVYAAIVIQCRVRWRTDLRHL